MGGDASTGADHGSPYVSMVSTWRVKRLLERCFAHRSKSKTTRLYLRDSSFSGSNSAGAATALTIVHRAERDTVARRAGANPGKPTPRAVPWLCSAMAPRLLGLRDAVLECTARAWPATRCAITDTIGNAVCGCNCNTVQKRSQRAGVQTRCLPRMCEGCRAHLCCPQNTVLRTTCYRELVAVGMHNGSQWQSFLVVVAKHYNTAADHYPTGGAGGSTAVGEPA